MISIIIPTFNRAHLIGETLSSLEDQSYSNWECLIIDDGSNDNTERIVQVLSKKDSRFKYFKRPLYMKKGPASCRNYGLELAKGSLIQFFDDDDIAHNSMLYEKNKLLLNNDLDACICKLQVVNVESNIILGQNDIYSSNLIKDYFMHDISWYICGPLWKKSFLKEIFDPEIELMDDWDFNLRNIYNNPKVGYLKIPLINYCKRGKSLVSLSGRNCVEQLNSEFNAFRKHYIILKDQKKISFDLNQFYIHRIIIIARKIGLKRSKLRREIITEALKRISFKDVDIIFRLSLCLISFLIFNKGYALLYYKR